MVSGDAELPVRDVPSRGSTTIPPHVASCLDLPSAALGFQAPPQRVHLKFLQSRHGWRLLARTAPGGIERVSKWLLGHGEAEVVIPAGLSPTILRAEYEVLPSAWEAWLELADTNHLDLDENGAATLYLRASGRPIDALLVWTRRNGAGVHTRPSAPTAFPDLLTPRQADALAVAAGAGYYDVPHRVGLRVIAERLGISVGAASGLLRRGEAAVIKAYLDHAARERWADVPGATGDDGSPSRPFATAEKADAGHAMESPAPRRPQGNEFQGGQR